VEPSSYQQADEATEYWQEQQSPWNASKTHPKLDVSYQYNEVHWHPSPERSAPGIRSGSEYTLHRRTVRP
jgi:hypothetical protein